MRMSPQGPPSLRRENMLFYTILNLPPQKMHSYYSFGKHSFIEQLSYSYYTQGVKWKWRMKLREVSTKYYGEFKGKICKASSKRKSNNVSWRNECGCKR